MTPAGTSDVRSIGALGELADRLADGQSVMLPNLEQQCEGVVLHDLGFIVQGFNHLVGPPPNSVRA